MSLGIIDHRIGRLHRQAGSDVDSLSGVISVDLERYRAVIVDLDGLLNRYRVVDPCSDRYSRMAVGVDLLDLVAGCVTLHGQTPH